MYEVTNAEKECVPYVRLPAAYTRNYIDLPARASRKRRGELNRRVAER